MKCIKDILIMLRRVWFRRIVRRGVKVLERMDGYMSEAGYKRTERRRFWREFVANQAERDRVFYELNKGSKGVHHV